MPLLLMTQPTAVRFPSQGQTLSGWLFLPLQHRGTAVIMSPGFSAHAEHGLMAMATALSQHGVTVLLYDHAGFGNSTGPQHEVHPRTQIQGYQSAIDYLTQHPELINPKIAVLGHSYSGGHALVLGALEPRVHSIIAVAPFINGVEATVRKIPVTRWQALQRHLKVGMKLNQKIPIIPCQNPNPMHFFSGDDQALAFFTAVPQWENRISVRSIWDAIHYTPDTYVPYIQKPMLVVIPENDQVANTDLQKKMVQRLRIPKHLDILPGGHFSPLTTQHIPCVQAIMNFLTHS